jgi:hypothetical protein
MRNFGCASARVGVAAGFLMVAAFFAAPASAACFEDIGCTNSDRYEFDDLIEMTCNTLFRIQDRIEEENDDDEDMNRVERHNLRVVSEAISDADCD